MLDSVPDLDMLAYLPQLLDGLMNLLSDPNREIRVAAHKCMMEFLVEIQVRRRRRAAAARCDKGCGSPCAGACCVLQPCLLRRMRLRACAPPPRVQATPSVDWVALASILVDKASSSDEFTRITAIKWIKVRGLTRCCNLNARC